MAVNIEKEAARAQSAGHTGINAFSGSVRNLDQTFLQEGDVVTFPDVYNESNSFSMPIGENGRTEYVLCAVKHKDGSEGVVQFYPSTFTKQRTVYQDTKPGELLKPVMEGGSQKRVRTLGTAADLFRNETSINEAMLKLAGNQVKVDKINMIKTKRYGQNELQETSIYTLNLVKK